MNHSQQPSQQDDAHLLRALHTLNNELSIAILELELLLESDDLGAPIESAVREALNACRRAAENQREIWARISSRSEQS